MDRILKICFCLIMIEVYWIPMADFQCVDVDYSFKCQVCTDDKNCPRCNNRIPTLECRHDHRCRCKKGFGRKGFGFDCVQAYRIVEYDERCDETNNTLCNNDDFLSCQPPVNGRCACTRGFARDADLKQCVNPNGEIFDVCRAEPDTCDTNAQLKCDKSTNRCLVKTGWKYNCTTQTYEKGIASYGESCEEESCKSVKFCCNPDLDLECQNEACVCVEGYYWDANATDGKCVRYREYKEPCSESIKCNPESNLECNDGLTCVCKEGLKYDEDKKRCEKGLTVLYWVLIGLSILLLLLLLPFLVYWFWYRKRKNGSGEGDRRVSGEGVRRVSSEGLPRVSGEVRENEVGGAGYGSENGGSKEEKKRRWWQGKEQKPKPTKKIPQNYDMPDTDAEFSNVSNLWQGKEQKPKPTKKIPQNYDMPDTDAEYKNISNLWRHGPPPSSKNKGKVTLNLKQDIEKSKIQADKEAKAKRPSTR